MVRCAGEEKSDEAVGAYGSNMLACKSYTQSTVQVALCNLFGGVEDTGLNCSDISLSAGGM